MKSPIGMAPVVVQLLCALCAFSVQGNFVQKDNGLLEAWQKRVTTTVASLQNNPCRALSRGSQCDSSTLANLDTRTVRLYTAQGQKKSKLRVVLTEGRRRRLTKHSHRNDTYDAVFVLDPYPDANFGHIVFIFLVDFDVNQTVCNKRLNGIHVFTGRDECIRRAEKRQCRNLLHMRVKCEINFIPLVYSEDDDTRTQLLECQQSVKTTSFAGCGVKEHFPIRCSDNSAHCLPGTDGVRPEPPYHCTYDICDHGVLISGGWDSFTSRPLYRNNLRNVWKLLHSFMRYKRENIITFFGQGQKDEFSPHQRDKSYAVNSAITVKEYISKLCRSSPCVDTITLYLTGPSKSDGSLLFWDNGNGLTDNSELYSPRELLEDVKNCSARRLFIVADYSYSGAMVNKIKSRMERNPGIYRNLVAISSTSWNQSSWRSDFAEAFVKRSKEGMTTKCVTDVVEEIKKQFQANGSRSIPHFETGVNFNATYTTLNGRTCNETWIKAKTARACRLLTRPEWNP